MPKPKHQQVDMRGLQVIADEFTGSGTTSGIISGAVATPVTITASAGSLPTPNGTVSVNATTPTVNELLEAIVEVNAKLTALLAAID